MKDSLIKKFISENRFKSYKDLDEYSKNLIFSQNSYIPLSILEVALRNALNNHLSKIVSDFWYEDDFLTADSKIKVSQAKALLVKRKEKTSKEKIIAELSFGFWVNLFKKPYEKKLRIKDIKLIFPNLPKKEEKLINRDILFTKLNHIRNFRNRVFHYEKVLNKDDFNNIHSEIFEIIKYFDDELYQYTKELY
ncbi:hypothetical protein [Aliarcobacter butzleri]|uniref:hypothetical protein n=1 Tax=Aliarcobacter butzleri TaxID=28197 RepID=UPI00125EA152|nr:hypothetical protein [Aliarcobacter butzleri]